MSVRLRMTAESTYKYAKRRGCADVAQLSRSLSHRPGVIDIVPDGEHGVRPTSLLTIPIAWEFGKGAALVWEGQRAEIWITASSAALLVSGALAAHAPPSSHKYMTSTSHVHNHQQFGGQQRIARFIHSTNQTHVLKL